MNKEEEKEVDVEGGGSSWWFVYPECHGRISRWDRYCKHCGQKLKWEEHE